MHVPFVTNRRGPNLYRFAAHEKPFARLPPMSEIHPGLFDITVFEVCGCWLPAGPIWNRRGVLAGMPHGWRGRPGDERPGTQKGGNGPA